MSRDEMVTEISMVTDIPFEDVEEVLDERDFIIAAERKQKKKKKCLLVTLLMAFFALGVASALVLLDKKDKVDIEATMRKYMDITTDKIRALQAQLTK